MLEKAVTFKKFEQSFQTRILEIVEYWKMNNVDITQKAKILVQTMIYNGKFPVDTGRKLRVCLMKVFKQIALHQIQIHLLKNQLQLFFIEHLVLWTESKRREEFSTKVEINCHCLWQILLKII